MITSKKLTVRERYWVEETDFYVNLYIYCKNYLEKLCFLYKNTFLSKIFEVKRMLSAKAGNREVETGNLNFFLTSDLDEKPFFYSLCSQASIKAIKYYKYYVS